MNSQICKRSYAVNFCLAFFIVLCLAVGTLADTIRLRDGSVIRGEIISFGEGQFTVLIGSGGRSGRRSRVTLYAEDVESIEFDSANAATTNGANAPSITSGSDSTAGTRAGSSNPSSDSTEATTNPSSGVGSSSSSSSSAASTAPRQPVFTSAAVRVRADNTTNGWTNSGIVVRRGQRLRINASGRVSLAPGRFSTPAGLRTVSDDAKLMREEATGALIAVIGNDNDDFIFIGTRREFTAQRDGVVFLGVNEGNLSDNTGAYDATVEYETTDGAR